MSSLVRSRPDPLASIPADVQAKLKTIPCPILRTLATVGALGKDIEHVPLGHVRRATAALTGRPVVGYLSVAIALFANSPKGQFWAGVKNFARNLFTWSVNLPQLNGGLVDKHADSGILQTNADGSAHELSLERMVKFAKPFTPKEGGEPELGWNLAMLHEFIDANMAAKGGGSIQKRIALGEFPPALGALKKASADGQEYLSVAEMSAIYRSQQLPDRILARLETLADVHGGGLLEKWGQGALDASPAGTVLRLSLGDAAPSPTQRAGRGMCPFLSGGASVQRAED